MTCCGREEEKRAKATEVFARFCMWMDLQTEHKMISLGYEFIDYVD